MLRARKFISILSTAAEPLPEPHRRAEPQKTSDRAFNYGAIHAPHWPLDTYLAT